MARAINVGVMPRLGLIFDMRCGYRNTTLPLFRSFVNGSIVHEFRESFFGLSFGNGSSQGGLRQSLSKSWKSIRSI